MKVLKNDKNVKTNELQAIEKDNSENSQVILYKKYFSPRQTHTTDTNPKSVIIFDIEGYLKNLLHSQKV